MAFEPVTAILIDWNQGPQAVKAAMQQWFQRHKHELLRLKAEGKLPGYKHNSYRFHLRDETGAHGVRSAVFSLEPQLALVFDVTSATDVPGADQREDGKHELGSGPTILRGTIIHPRIAELLVECAEAERIPYTLEVAGGVSMTDADAIHLARAGVPTGLVSIPLRYMHSPIELCDLEDVENTIRLTAAFLRRLEPGTDFAR